MGARPRAVEDEVSLEVLESVAEELRRHGVRARVRPGWRGVLDLYILEDDAELLDRLCDEKKLSKTAEELLIHVLPVPHSLHGHSAFLGQEIVDQPKHAHTQPPEPTTTTTERLTSIGVRVEQLHRTPIVLACLGAAPKPLDDTPAPLNPPFSNTRPHPSSRGTSRPLHVMRRTA